MVQRLGSKKILSCKWWDAFSQPQQQNTHTATIMAMMRNTCSQLRYCARTYKNQRNLAVHKTNVTMYPNIQETFWGDHYDASTLKFHHCTGGGGGGGRRRNYHSSMLHSSSSTSSSSLRELAKQFRQAKNMKEMHTCISSLEQFALQHPNQSKSSQIALYSIALDMAMKEDKIDDVRKIMEVAKPYFYLMDIQTLKSLTLYFGRYYKNHPEQLRHIQAHAMMHKPKKASPTSVLCSENSPIEFMRVVAMTRKNNIECLSKIAPLAIASALMNDEFKFAHIILDCFVDATLIHDQHLREKHEEYVFVGESQSTFSGLNELVFHDATKASFLEFTESVLRIIIKKLRQNMLKLSAYTCKTETGHMTFNDQIYKDTCNSIIDTLSLAVQTISKTTTNILPYNFEGGIFDENNVVELNDELCTKISYAIEANRTFMDASPSKKLTKKFRDQVTNMTSNALDEYLKGKRKAFKESMGVKEDPYIQFRMEYKVKVDKDGVLNSDISNAYVNPNPIQAGNTIIYNHFEIVDDSRAKVVVTGRSYTRPEQGRGNEPSLGTEPQEQPTLEQAFVPLLSMADEESLAHDHDVDGIKDDDFW
ncbi:hypothetical protein C9374_009789 [Naegleria lovaniensis]|uniref:Uncharacterized protein n=1 Tax=Naegleria lovaniensis TaxID=51637 RepID=A0AA88H5G7_NAELO|nr:uncharacterized protein C9374_009789 [Naegleria lovaniensis]KAG2393212.1 hypothetical protein C9374_009789 [Naegleria lovaniensis]